MNPIESVSEGVVVTPCHIVAIYDQFESGTVARETCHSISRALGSAEPCQLHLWRFDVLKLPEVATRVAVEIGAAKVLLVAVDGRKQLPEPMPGWFEHALSRKEPNSMALGGLLRGSEVERSEMPAYRRLEEVADHVRLPFFVQTFELSSRTPLDEISRDQRVQSLLTRTMCPIWTPRAWGIND